jgi:bifunctional non-homologous end joining protein LigD
VSAAATPGRRGSGGRGGPPTLRPMLAGGSGWPTGAERYQIEPKLDGQRLIVRIDRGGVVDLRTRNANDATSSYPELARPPDALADRSAVLDGEAVAFDAAGRTDFQRLQARMHVRHPPASLLAEVPIAFVVFDVLWLDGELLVERAQTQRRAVLEGLRVEGGVWQVSPILHGERDDLLAGCRALGLEGLMAKRRDAPYLPGERSSAWVKVKVRRQREFVVGGWAAGAGSRQGHLGSLAIGYVDPQARVGLLEGPALRYAGQVGSGLNQSLITQLEVAFARYGRDASPFIDTPAQPKLHFVAPLLVVEVAFAEVTHAGTLRHPTLLGLRPDVLASEVGWDDELAH